VPVLAISGIGGFIGRRLAGRARAAGYRVRGLERDGSRGRAVAELGCQVIHGDVCDPRDARDLARGADAVVHTAAMVQEDGSFAEFRRVNVDGTANVLNASREAGVARVVHLSSVMVYGFRFPFRVDESGPLRGENNPYCQTKIESEEVARRVHRPGRLDVVILRPGDVYGPGSVPWVVRPIELMRRRLFALPDGGRGTMNHLFVDNLVDAIVRSLRTASTGRAFNVTDDATTSFATYFQRLALLVGTPLPRAVPGSGLRLAIAGLERGARLFGRRPPASAAAIDFIRRPHPYSVARARRELGYAPRVGLDQGLRLTERWLRDEGIIARQLATPVR
jgi:nucleoside-diphosphate-sugar epimerase